MFAVVPQSFCTGGALSYQHDMQEVTPIHFQMNSFFQFIIAGSSRIVAALHKNKCKVIHSRNVAIRKFYRVLRKEILL